MKRATGSIFFFNVLFKSETCKLVYTQGSYRSWKTWKVMELKSFSFQAWKVMKFNCWLGKGMENYSVRGTEIIAGVD